ncbi:MAG TPA: AAA family ATPase [Trebonia sp.]|jgi:MinD-like ATPase involved in chromosome partitioning or flagellar assembly|nr:AAA family ATPase [Trebonia sp.]
MTADEHDNTASGAREATELYPFSSGYPQHAGTARGPLPDWQAADQPLPDLPVMEQLPDPDALPDPGYPAMPATPPPVASQPPPLRPPWPAPPPLEEPSVQAASPTATPAAWIPPAHPSTPPAAAEPARQPPSARALPPEEPATGKVELPPIPHREFEPRHSAQRPLDVQPTWTPDPYTAPRPPEAAPPLRGPSVPWSQVRVGIDVQATGEPGPAPVGAPPSRPAQFPPAQMPSPQLRPPQPPPDTQAHRPTADTLTSDLLLPGKRANPDGGWRRTVYRATGGLVRVGESAASLQRRDLIGRVRAPVAGGHHRVAVLSLKGGVGKTTATVGLGSTLASLRGDRVIAVDGNPDRGTLSDKVRLETSATIRDLLNERSLVTRYADVRAYTSQASSRLEILASDRDPGVSVAFSADDYRTVVGVLEQYYSICITDCGTGLLHSAMAGILELADQIVLVSSPSVDGARSASATLDWLEAHGYEDLVAGGVVVLSAIRRKSKSTVDLDRLEQHFAARSRAVVRVPYDPHLEEGAEVELEMLNEETADAYLSLAALVADGFAHPRRSRANTTSGSPFA